MVLYLLKILQIKGSSYNFIRVENETVNVNKLYNEKKKTNKKDLNCIFSQSLDVLYIPHVKTKCVKNLLIVSHALTL